MPTTIPSTTKFQVPYTSYANWGNYRFLTNNGTSTVYPGAVTGLVEASWNHGGIIDYIKPFIVLLIGTSNIKFTKEL